MKSILIGTLLLFLISCSSYKTIREENVQALDLNSLNSPDYIFSVIIHDLRNDNYFIFNDSLSKIKHSPASTFKIANSIIALETKVVSDEFFELPWDGVTRSYSAWNQTQNLNSAFKNSTVWYFQEVARRIGPDRMIDGLEKINYCNPTFRIKNDIDQFWLNGNLKKSLVEQVLFIDNLASKKLKIQKKTYGIMDKIMASDTISDAYFYSKTGWAVEENEDIGWYVGHVFKNKKKYVFGTLIKTSNYEKVDISNLRKDMTLFALKHLGIIN